MRVGIYICICMISLYHIIWLCIWVYVWLKMRETIETFMGCKTNFLRMYGYVWKMGKPPKFTLLFWDKTVSLYATCKCMWEIYGHVSTSSVGSGSPTCLHAHPPIHQKRYHEHLIVLGNLRNSLLEVNSHVTQSL